MLTTLPTTPATGSEISAQRGNGWTALGFCTRADLCRCCLAGCQTQAALLLLHALTLHLAPPAPPCPITPLCNRAATYSGLLLAAAQQHPRFVEGLERQLAAFVADKELKR